MYRYELHMHSREASACAGSDIHEMIRHYAKLGFAGAVVTNHFVGGNTSVNRKQPWEDIVRDYSRAYYEGLETARALDFDLLFGVEEGYSKGKEFLVYGIDPEFLLERPFLRKAPVETWYRETRQVGAFMAYAHPFRRRYYVVDPWAMPDLRWVDGVEVYNRGNTPEDNQQAAAVFGPMNLVELAGSDSHYADFDEAWGICLDHRVRTGPELAGALHRRDFSLWLGR